LITTPSATIIPPSTGAQASWLDREYMVVIVAVSAFAVFLLLSICVLCIVRLYHTNNIMRGMLRLSTNTTMIKIHATVLRLARLSKPKLERSV